MLHMLMRPTVTDGWLSLLVICTMRLSVRWPLLLCTSYGRDLNYSVISSVSVVLGPENWSVINESLY